MENDRCCSCDCDLTGDRGRRTLKAQTKGRQFPLNEALTALGVDLSDETYESHLICPSCSAKIGKYYQSTINVEVAKSRLMKSTNSDTYLGCKLKKLLAAPGAPPGAPPVVSPGAPPGAPHVAPPVAPPLCESGRQSISSCSPAGVKSYKSTRTQTEESTLCPKKMRPHSFLTHAASHIIGGRYSNFLSCMHLHSSTFSTTMVKFVGRAIVQELMSITSHFHTKSGKLVSYETFSWPRAYADIKKRCPMLLQFLETFLRRKATKEDGVPLTMIVSQLLYARSPQNRLIPELTGLLLWFGGCRKQTIESLKNLGICRSHQAIMKCLEILRKEYDQPLLTEKTRISDYYKAQTVVSQQSDDGQENAGSDHEESEPLQTEMSDAAVTEPRPDPSPDSERIEEGIETIDEGLNQSSQSSPDALGENDEEEISDDDAMEDLPKGFTLSLDKMNPKPRYKVHTTKDKHMQKLNLIQVSGTLNRVPSFHLNDKAPSPSDLANITPEMFLPNDDDMATLRNEYEVMIARIIAKRIRFFRKMKVTDHIWHPYQRETKKPSIVVPLAVLHKDEAKEEDMKDVLNHLRKYAPDSEVPVPVVLYGDQLSCKRARDAIAASSQEDTPRDQHGVFHPSVQEWRKQLFTLQDAYALLYDIKSTKSCGTLSFIRSKYQLYGVTRQVTECFNDARSMLRFSTESYVVAAACEYLGISSLRDKPKGWSGDPDDVPKFFTETCNAVLEKAFHPINFETQTEKGSYCTCQTTRDTPMVLCGNTACDRGKWFHLECIGEELENLPTGDWYCSEDCSHQQKEHQEPKKQKTSGETQREATVFKGCDSIYEYSKAMLFLGLGEMVRHDAIKEGDGDRMITHWKFDMLQFYQNRHWKNFIEGHYLLMDVNGGVSERLAHQLTWNRTVNVNGGQGRNSAGIPGREFLENYFMEAVKSAKENLTASEIATHCEDIVIKQILNTLFEDQVQGNNLFATDDDVKVDDNNVAGMVEILLKEKCLVRVPGRFHIGFKNFQFGNSFFDLDNYKYKIAALCTERVKRSHTAV